RRKFLKNATIGALAGLLGTDIVFAATMPSRYVPLLFQGQDPADLFGKHKEMIVLNKRPWNMESPAHLLDDDVTPAGKMFVRNNGLIPEKIEMDTWSLTIDGESVRQKKTYSLSDLKTHFKTYTYQLTLECGGNGRSEYFPPAEGNQWNVGAVSCARWTGIRLRDLLLDTGIKDNAVYVGYHGADSHLSRDPAKEAI